MPAWDSCINSIGSAIHTALEAAVHRYRDKLMAGFGLPDDPAFKE